VIELAGKLGVPYVGTASGTTAGKKLAEQAAEIVGVYESKYFAACQANRVRILWEPWPEGPNIATGPLGYEALLNAFGNSPPMSGCSTILRTSFGSLWMRSRRRGTSRIRYMPFT